MKTLILGTSYISAASEGAQNYPAKVVNLWARLARHLNPDCDILIVDSDSPADVSEVTYPIDLTVLQLGDNIGHINVSNRDGWGRAFCAGVDEAIAKGYDYIAYCDVDIISSLPVGAIIDRMARAGVRVACPMDCQYNFLENGLMFLEVDYLRASKFVERYDWPNRTRSADPMEIPEVVFEKLMADDLFTLPIRTFRDDRGILTAHNIEHLFPYGLDALTHTKYEVYERFLEIKGIKL